MEVRRQIDWQWDRQKATSYLHLCLYSIQSLKHNKVAFNPPAPLTHPTPSQSLQSFAKFFILIVLLQFETCWTVVTDMWAIQFVCWVTVRYNRCQCPVFDPCETKRGHFQMDRKCSGTKRLQIKYKTWTQFRNSLLKHTFLWPSELFARQYFRSFWQSNYA